MTQKLRPECSLNLTLLGHNVLTKNEANLIYKSSGISLLLNDICIQTGNELTNSTFYIQHAQYPQPNLHANPQDPESSIQTSHKDFMALFNMCQYEKAFNYYQKQVDVCSAKILAGAEVKERNSVGFQNIAQYQEAGVFGPTIGGSDQFCSNLTLTKRPSAHMSSFQTLADKNQNKIDKRLGQKEDPGEQLVRLTCDLRLSNRQTLNDNTISLPTF